MMFQRVRSIVAVASLALVAGVGSAHASGGFGWRGAPAANPSSVANVLLAGAALSPSDAWAVGYDTSADGSSDYSLTEHWNGSAWTAVASPNPFGNGNILQGVSALGSADAWAVGYSSDSTNYYSTLYQPLIEHWNGLSWQTVSSPGNNGGYIALFGVAAVSQADVWAVGSYGTSSLIENWNGAAWSTVSHPDPSAVSDELRALTAISPNDVWAAGEYLDSRAAAEVPLFEHWDGRDWRVVSGPSVSGADNEIVSLAGSSSSDIWAVGYTRSAGRPTTYGALIEHWDGAKWRIVSSPTPKASSNYNLLLGVTSLSASDAWAVGYGAAGTGAEPLLEHWDGSRWSLVSAPVPTGSSGNFLNAAMSTGTGSVWAIGRSDRNALVLSTGGG
jgi:hypothetical protein